MRQRIEWTPWVEELLADHGLRGPLGHGSAQLIVAVLVALLAVVGNLLARRVIVSWVHLFTSRTENGWDDVLAKHNVFQRTSHFVPALIVYALMPLAFPGSEWHEDLIHRFALSYMLLAGTLVIDGALTASIEIYDSKPENRQRPINAFVQGAKLLLYLAATVFVLAALLKRSPWGFITGLGAMTAVLLLVFKDTILGFVASVQLLGHDMVRRGDWIEVPKFAADGEVIDISVTTVKVRNWDMTVAMLPTYALIAESFRNWRGMTESGGRRVKRALLLDMHTVKLCTPELVDRFERIALIADYVRERRAEIESYNRELGVDTRELVNGRRMTNLGTFRAYVVAYLRKHPHVRQDMTVVVRHLSPTSEGLPLELYFFAADTAFVDYEAVQADIFDHLIAIVPQFELRVFQRLAQ